MKKYLSLVIFVMFSCSEKNDINFDFTTKFEKSNGIETATYQETINYYKALEKTFKSIKVDSFGTTDSGFPLHLVTLNPDAEFNFRTIAKDKRIILINNGIHPGESDGIDATMMLFRDLANGTIKMPKNVVLTTIPIYNIGGSLNRNNTTRTNQNGPLEYGFRGNARNYDLNRDFIKSDTKNAKTFAEIFHTVNPDVFIDNHVSNGADYQYTLTHLFTQHNKLGGELGIYLNDQLMPKLEQSLNNKDWIITPYVNVFNRTPESGFSQFFDSPRYSTGYTTLFNCLGMMVETHMLKPYQQRVEGAYELMASMLQIVDNDSEVIKDLRNKQAISYNAGDFYPLNWELDTTKSSILNFKGFEAENITSTVTGLPRLKYNSSKPFEKEVVYKNYFKPSDSVAIPKAYVIPQGWHDVIELLEINHVELNRFKTDTIIEVESYRITDYKTRTSAYEGHYSHYNTKVEVFNKQINFRKGDYYIETKQNAVRYLLETLEPKAVDSFFNWNFFDTILQQKEGFSPYVWEDKIIELFAQNPRLQIAFNMKKSLEPDFAKNWYAQLDWLHKQSDFYEKAHMQYPVYRIN
ncbi:hypothetical protein FJ651_08240 [Paucihalobacter ruber]|uniref:Uncharacterized protein n=1 Tax=Paucihalobacter ruber TaxID=2567861 RepID=A0A506PLF0_9FLAO|nr:M14 family metallopeptidase [Paucihalobacter ruber]TPV34135.1 hypothetical protein FJ651_08240 [Paucihalobacter ruber]